jgi:hypothetical protein
VLGPVDWSAPWFEPLRADGEPILQRSLAGVPLHQALNECGPGRVTFVPQSALPSGVPYESYVFESGCCPTRDNLHDFFNALIWRQLPQSKHRLNELQAAHIAVQGAGVARGPLRDAITVFDENGALLDAPAALWEALLAGDWKRALVDMRPLWAHARVRVFGHALLEKMAQPRKAITAHVWRSQCPMGATDELDSWLAARLTAEALARKPFMPLPLFGIPGWCEENQQVSFYDDPVVFRPRRP